MPNVRMTDELKTILKGIACGNVVVKALCYKREGNIKVIMFLGIKVRRVRRADNLTAICEPIV
jgi:hypothetical protein